MCLVMTKLHLDTDLGGDIDDLCALAMLLRWPDVDLLAVTTNSDDRGKRAGYARYVLDLAGRADVAVAAGADVALGCYRVQPGLPDEAAYWPEPIPPFPTALEEALALLERSIAQGAIIVAIGAFTNLALLERRSPGILREAHLVLMGGYVFPPRPGFPPWGCNMDWNVQVDVSSASLVIERSTPTLVPLSVTVETALRRAHLPTLRRSGPLGQLIARQAEVVWDTGAYADVGPLLCRNGSYSVTGPYRIPNQWIDGYCVYTNKLVTGAFRGYGIMEMAFAYESQMDSIARALGIDPVEMRRRNLIKDGDETATGEVLYNVGLKAALEACARAMEWERPRPPGRGKAIVTTAKSSVAPSGSAAFVRLNDDGTVTVMVSTTEMGQGSRTVMAQMAAEALGARLEDVQVLAADTLFTPPDRSTSSSRSTFHMGNAVVQAARDAREQLIKKASALLEAHPDDLEVRESRVFVKGVPDRYLTFRELAAVRPGVDMGPILGRGSFVPAGARPLDLETGQSPRITAFWLYTSQGVEVEVDRETGKVRVLRVVSVHDAGRSINPDACEAQIEGGVAQACSAALLEELVLDEEGRLLNPAFGDYLLATSKDVPPISPVIVEVPHAEGPYGAKGLGEGPTTGIAAALANAIEDATGVRIRELPLTPERVLRALKEKERSREEAT